MGLQGLYPQKSAHYREFYLFRSPERGKSSVAWAQNTSARGRKKEHGTAEIRGRTETEPADYCLCFETGRQQA
jgi:hypothetical protein